MCERIQKKMIFENKPQKYLQKIFLLYLCTIIILQ